jgi:protein-disulfide isomerase
MSGSKDREKRREERIAAESKAASGDRRTRLLQLSAAGVFLAIIVVVVIIIVAGSSSKSGGDASNLTETTQVDKLLSGIPQNGTVLGKSTAPVTLYEYGDLQCPICKEYSEEILPAIIEKQVKNGEVKIVYRDFIIISEESIPAGEAALAAGEQGKGWSFIELFYRNQGEERSGYVTDAFIEGIAEGAGVPDMKKFNEERKSGKFKKTVEKTTEQAQKFGFTGTPSFAVEGPSSNGIELLNTPGSTEAIVERIEQAA